LPVPEPLASLRLTQRYPAAPGEVWSALTDAARLGRWLGRVTSGRIAAGERLELDVAGTSVAVVVRTLEPERRLELGWALAGEEPSIVRFELSPEDKGTLLVVDHTRLDERRCMRYGAYWRRGLDLLDTVAGVVSR
jgi:uncharacterized protein YndB with AHSA1/START domain